MTNYAEIVTKTFVFAYDDQALAMACKIFGLSAEEVTALAGTYKKGKNKGKLKGQISYKSVEVGGWFKTGGYNDGYVVAPHQKYDYKISSLVYTGYGYIPDATLCYAGASAPVSIDNDYGND